MKKYLAHWCFILLMISFNTSLAQENLEKDKAKNSVNKFMSEKDKNYQPLTFGEFFIQTYPKEVQKKLQTKKEVVYSIVHTYSIGEMKFEDMYFHLSDKYKVIGKLSSKEMDEVTNGILKKSGALDSLMNSIEIPND